MLTDEAGGVISRHDYQPFGQNNQPLTGNPRRFTGKELDAETALHYFGARYYRNLTARFTTVDPALTLAENLADPQRWNRYSYVRNNPLRYTDPDGRAIDILLDLGFIATDVYNIARSLYKGEGVSKTDLGALGLDVVGAVVPFVTGLGKGLKAAVRAEKAAATAQTAARGLGFSSFAAFKRAMGPAGKNLEWHHIVGQTEDNVARFGAETIHNTLNVVRLDVPAHRRINGYYSSIQDFTNGQTVRTWLGKQSLEAQQKFGMETLQRLGGVK